MNRKKLNFILQKGEGQYVEFKESLNSSLSKEIVSFANASGGRIFLGVSDKNKVNGIVVTNKLKSQIQDLVRNCEPNIEISFEEFENVLIINIKEGKNKPYSCSSGFYLRVGPNSQKMKRDEIFEMIKKSSQFSFDDSYVNLEENFDNELFINFLRENKINSDLDSKSILKSMNLIDSQDRFSNASILLFGRDLKKVCLSAYLECVLFKGSNRSEVLDRKKIEGTLFNQLKEGLIFLKKHLKVRYEFPDEKRREIYDVPLRALEEALVNALIHRDYSIKGANISLFIYEDRVEVISPGGLAPGLDESDFGKISIRRNELIADIFSKTGYVEKIGSGIKRMKELCLKQNNPEPVYSLKSFFIITFPFLAKKSFERVNVGKNQPKTSQKPAKNQRKEMILERIKKGFFRKRSFADELGMNKSTIESDLDELKSEGKIEFIGSKKGGKWIYKK